MSIPRKMFSSFQKPLNSVTSRGHQQGAQVVMRGAADRPLAVAAVSIAAAASLAWLSRRRHRRRLAFTEAHVLAAMLRSGAISSAALPAGMTVPCWWCHGSPLRLRAALRSSNASLHRPGLMVPWAAVWPERRLPTKVADSVRGKAGEESIAESTSHIESGGELWPFGWKYGGSSHTR